MATQPIFQFYAELGEYKPKNWRRFQVMNDITVARLGYILMTLFEMQASHLFCFEVPLHENIRTQMLEKFSPEDVDRLFSDDAAPINPVRLEIPSEDFEPADVEGEKVYDARKQKIKNMISHPGDRMNFTYDYGDNWWVSLVLEEVICDGNLSRADMPRALEGEGFGIVEDCGGVDGLERLAKAFKKKKGPEYRELREWLGVDDLNLNAFDLDDMNFRLKKIPRIYMQAYEQDLAPTRRSIDLIERRYLKK